MKNVKRPTRGGKTCKVYVRIDPKSCQVVQGDRLTLRK